jgi:hypothetical protein
MLMGGDGTIAILEVEECGHLSGSLTASDRSLIPSGEIIVNNFFQKVRPAGMP